MSDNKEAPPADAPAPEKNAPPENKDDLKHAKEKLALKDGTETKSFGKRPALLILANKNIRFVALRNDPIMTIIIRELDINGQDTLSGITYDVLLTLTREQLRITREQFIQLWKTLLLKRSQDIYESTYKIRPQNYIRINRNLIIPATLADLLSSLGTYQSYHKGYRFDLQPPAHPVADPPRWWQPDQAIITSWYNTMNQLRGKYLWKEYPSPQHYDQGTINLCSVNRANGYCMVKAYTNEAKLTDAYIAVCNDDLYGPHPIVNFDNSHLIMTERLALNTIRREYVSSYILKR